MNIVLSSRCSSIPTHLELPQTLKSIGSSAFSNCSNIKQITINENVESIERNAFTNNEIYMIYTLKREQSIGQELKETVGILISINWISIHIPGITHGKMRLAMHALSV